jgi:hypothetical protein
MKAKYGKRNISQEEYQTDNESIPIPGGREVISFPGI